MVEDKENMTNNLTLSHNESILRSSEEFRRAPHRSVNKENRKLDLITDSILQSLLYECCNIPSRSILAPITPAVPSDPMSLDLDLDLSGPTTFQNPILAEISPYSQEDSPSKILSIQNLQSKNP